MSSDNLDKEGVVKAMWLLPCLELIMLMVSTVVNTWEEPPILQNSLRFLLLPWLRIYSK